MAAPEPLDMPRREQIVSQVENVLVFSIHTNTVRSKCVGMKGTEQMPGAKGRILLKD